MASGTNGRGDVFEATQDLRSGSADEADFADRIRNLASARNWNVIWCSLGLLRGDTHRGQGKPTAKKVVALYHAPIRKVCARVSQIGCHPFMR